MTMDERLGMLATLRKEYKNPQIELSHGSPLQLLVATILSAQCTDKRVNIVTKGLFKKYKTAEDYANADLKIFEQEIKSTGFYRNKARNIKNAAQKIVKEFNGKVPKTMAELLTLPGVARKTANIVLTAGYGIVEGIAVDTHVKRLAYRLGLSENTSPEKIELDLMKLIPKADWGVVNMTLVLHGRYVCQAKKPKCSECVLNKICPKMGVTGWL